MDKIKYLTDKIKSLTVEIDIIREQLSQCSTGDFEELNLSIANLNGKVDELGESLNNINNKFPMVESDVSNLKNKVNSAEEKIQSCERNVTQNTADISHNADNIAQNTADIAQNALDIEQNTLNIEQNTADITQNTTDISSNSEKIAQNTTKIAQNIADISSNSTKIAQNTANIETNASNIARISQDISVNTQNIATNVQNITNNTESINTNAQNIAINTKSIATNTQNIASNSQNISSNTEKINNNTQQISANSMAINTNAQNISANSASISVNAQAIEGNSQKIASNLQKINANAESINAITQSISTNTQNITSNTQNIATNTQNISNNTQKISANTQNISTNASNIVKLTEKCNAVEDSQANLSTSFDAHVNEFLVERTKLQNVTGEFYGENLLENSHLTCNQRGASTNQTTKCFMFDRWYKACTNEAKVFMRPDGVFEIRFLKTLTAPIRIVEQRIDLHEIFQQRDVVLSMHVLNCTVTVKDCAGFGAEYFNSAGESLGVVLYSFNSTGIKVLPGFIPNGAVSVTYFFQANTGMTKGGLIRFRDPKIEFGKVASKFGGRSDDYEMRLCHKHYYTTGISEENALTLKAISETEFEPSIFFLPTPMARVPDITLLGVGGVKNILTCVEEGGSNISVSAVPVLDGQRCFKIIATNAVAGGHYKLCGYTADAESVPQNVNITEDPDPIEIW
ncbi:MAG: hypothetical protein ACI4L7_01930 [Christensenellales bacterium]